MTKLTTEITIEELQYRINAHENDLTQMWTADYFLNVQKELLALKQAAKNSADLKTLVISEIVDFYAGFESPCEPETVDEAQRQLIGRIEKVFGLAAPVLPKQPEPVAWRFDELAAKGMVVTVYKSVANSWIARGFKATPLFELAPAQPVIPRQLTQRMAEEKALSLGAVLYDEEADVFADGWNACRAEMLKAQPVSEPYKLPDGWAMVPEEATIVMLTLLGLTGSFDFMQQKYKNMLAAAPTAQESE